MNYFVYLKYLKNIFLKKTPLHVTLFVTNKCNFRCKMCFYHENLNNTSGEISLDEYRKLSKTMEPFFWLLISGGEPFLREDLAQICAVFCENNGVKNISIPTNGWYTDKVVAASREILKHNPKVNLNVMVNMEGVGGLHDEITEIKGSYDQAMITIGKLHELSSEFPNFSLGAALTYSRHNQHGFVELVDHLLAMKKFTSITAGLTRGCPKDKAALHFDVGNFVKAVNKILSAYQDRTMGYAKRGFDLFSRIYFLLYRDAVTMYRTNNWKNPCYAGTSNVVMVPNGDVFPCELLSDKFGNLRDVDFNFKALWFNQTGDGIRNMIKKTSCRCFHTCYTSTNIVFNPKRMLGVVFASIGQHIHRSKRWVLK